MNALARGLAFPFELLVYGPSYAHLQRMIRSEKPLQPGRTWMEITEPMHPFLDWARQVYPPPITRELVLRAKLKQDHVLGIAEHYDVSNDFYKLFLDQKYMFYSCADFPTGSETLEEAQTAKANYIFNLLDPQPGERILELGCGWGAMMKRIYEATGDRENLYGYTLSKEQVAYNEATNGFQVEFRNFVTCDYPEQHFDKIYSIGAWEHVRKQEIPQLLAKLYRSLKPGGRLVKHFFGNTSDRHFAAVAVSQLFFPGSLGASYRFHAAAFEAAGFRITHCSVHDYRPTLRAWFDNLVRNRKRAIELVGVPTYNRYLVFFPTSWRYFDDKLGMVTRWVLEKPS